MVKGTVPVLDQARHPEGIWEL